LQTTLQTENNHISAVYKKLQLCEANMCKDNKNQQLAATLRGSRPGVQSASL